MPVFFRELQVDGRIDRAISVARGAVREANDYWMPALFMRWRKGRIWAEEGREHQIVIDDIKQSIMTTIAEHYKHGGIERNLIAKQTFNKFPIDTLRFDWHLQKLIDLDFVGQRGDQLFIKPLGMDYLGNAKPDGRIS
jgi:hypothetical protein